MLIIGVFTVFLQSCSSSKNESQNLIVTIVENDSNSLSKITVIEYNKTSSGIGSDDEYGTEDDDIFRYFEISDQGYLDDSSNKAKIIAYNSSGADNLWFTDDDIEFSSNVLDRTHPNEKYYARFNLDWLASYGDLYYLKELSDIEVLNYLFLGVWPELLTQGFGVNQSVKYNNDVYFDGTYTTYSSVEIYKIFMLNEKEIQVNFGNVIFNEQLGLYNFSIDYYSEKSIDPETKIETLRNSNSAGKDGIWFTEDDVFSSGFTTIETEGATLKTETLLRYIDPGSDGEWFTEDDLFNSREISTFDSNGNLLTHNFVYSGNDNLLDTSDDNVSQSYRQVHEISETEHKIVREHVENFGTDGESVIWSDIGTYNIESEEPVGVKLETSAILTPEGFNFYQYKIIDSSLEGLSTKKHERTRYSNSLPINDLKIEKIVESIQSEDLILVSEKTIKTAALTSNVFKSTIESRSSEGVEKTSTFVKIIRNQ